MNEQHNAKLNLQCSQAAKEIETIRVRSYEGSQISLMENLLKKSANATSLTTSL